VHVVQASPCVVDATHFDIQILNPHLEVQQSCNICVRICWHFIRAFTVIW